MGIGLTRGEVKILPHQSSWAVLFQTEKQKLCSIESTYVVAIEHIGSTSVPGLPAKPIVDVMIGIKKFSDFKKLVQPLKRIGYKFHSVPRAGQAFFFKEDEFGMATCHLKVVRYKGTNWNNYLKFRDALRGSNKYRAFYSKLKLELADRFKNDRNSYTSLKNNFIQKVLEE